MEQRGLTKMFYNTILVTSRMMVMGFLILGLTSVGVASRPAEPEECFLPRGGGGGGIPSPFSATNQHVELAVGESYNLEGTVVSGPELDNVYSSPNQAADSNLGPFFKVDLEVHPWLASQIRRNSPFYPLQGGWAFWGRYQQRRIRVTVQAQGKYVVSPAHGEVLFVLGLAQIDGIPIEVISSVY